jgi:predicted enzyme related to lactoylglutathione lyase
MEYCAVFVALADPDSERLVQFYKQLLSQEPASYIPQVYAEFQLPQLRLGIFKPSKNHQSEFKGQSSGSMSLCIEVEQLEAAIAHLSAIGYPPSGEITVAAHGREIYAYDPAGNRLILHEALQNGN